MIFAAIISFSESPSPTRGWRIRKPRRFWGPTTGWRKSGAMYVLPFERNRNIKGIVRPFRQGSLSLMGSQYFLLIFLRHKLRFARISRSVGGGGSGYQGGGSQYFLLIFLRHKLRPLMQQVKSIFFIDLFAS